MEEYSKSLIWVEEINRNTLKLNLKYIEISPKLGEVSDFVVIKMQSSDCRILKAKFKTSLSAG